MEQSEDEMFVIKDLEEDRVIYGSNYRIKKFLAYTEDEVLVHKIFVDPFPRQATVSDVHEYFSRFGPIKDVRIVTLKRFKKSLPPKVAFVNFERALDAARALLFKQHNILGECVFLNVCDSWHQPDGANKYLPLRRGKYIKKKRIVADEDVSVDIDVSPPRTDNILGLSDDCLEHIIRRMPLRTQINFARTCTRTLQLYRMTSKSLHRTFKLDGLKTMTVWEIRDFFDITGEYITRIESADPYGLKHITRIIKYLDKFCKNVREIHLMSLMMPIEDWIKFFRALPNLTYAQLEYAAMNDRATLEIRNLKKLKTLRIIFSNTITGKHFHTLPRKIEILSLKDCNALQTGNMQSLCMRLTNLKELNIEQCPSLTYVDFQHMVEACRNLETLTFSLSESNYELVAQLPKLKSLTIHVLPRRILLRPTLFSALARYKSNQLEYLWIKGINCVNDENAKQISRLKALRTLICPNNDELSGKGLKFFYNHENLEEIVLRGCKEVCNHSLLRLALSCQTLHRIHLQHCQIVSDSLIFELIQGMPEQMRSNRLELKKPVELIFEPTMINRIILNDPVYLASAHLVAVKMKHVPKFGDFTSDQVYDCTEPDYNFILYKDRVSPVFFVRNIFNNFTDSCDDFNEEF